MAFQIPRIPYLKLKFVLTAKQDCFLPEVKGSMLRGAFGNALKRTVCVMPSQKCNKCMLRMQYFEYKYIIDDPIYLPFCKHFSTKLISRKTGLLPIRIG